MSSPTRPQRPRPMQYLGYCFGRTLPESMRDWVRNDLAGKGAASRMVVRASVPCALLLAPSLVIPMSLYLHLSMTLPIFIPFVYFSIALNKVYRRARLSQHHLDPELVDELAHRRDAHLRDAYEQRYGPRE